MIKVHLDTTFLMPLFGLEPSIPNLKREFLEILEANDFTFRFSVVSIIEIKWQVIKLIRLGTDAEKLEKKFSQALISLKEDERYKPSDLIDSKINDLSFELRKLGHEDYFDTVIASSALWESEIFITEDNPLKEIITYYFEKNNNPPVKLIKLLSWQEFFETRQQK